VRGNITLRVLNLVGSFALVLAVLASGFGFPAARAEAAPTPRVQIVQRGDFVLIGNPLAFACEASPPAPIVGTVGACGTNTGDSGPDIFWRSDSPGPGQAEANLNIGPDAARSTSVLALPAGAQVTHAYLYWGGRVAVGTPADLDATIDRPGGFSTNVTAFTSYTEGGDSYQSVADVTQLVQENGPGAYRVGGVNLIDFRNLNEADNFAGWWMAVIYKLNTEPLRQINLYDSLDIVFTNTPQSATLSGFLVPSGTFDARLGVVAYEGDTSLTGDSLIFNGGTISDALNPANNFFNRSRSYLGQPVSVPGDLPQLTGNPGSVAAMDIDVFDITSRLTAGQTQAPFQATSSSDTYWLAGFVTTIATDAPEFTNSTKETFDLNGGSYSPGDTVEYRITVRNTGTDNGVSTVVTDPLPQGVTYVPGSLQVVSGPNTGAKTDAAGDDQAEYDQGANRVTFRVGMGANAVQGGAVPLNQETVVSFRVAINQGVVGRINNRATITARGERGAGPQETPIDGPTDLPAVLISKGTTSVTEGGATDSYAVSLATVPTSQVVVTLTPANNQIDLGAGPGQPTTLTFAPNSSALTPQTVTVAAVNDVFQEGNHTSLIAHSAQSGDDGYNGATARFRIGDADDNTVDVQITDDGDTTPLTREVSIAAGDPLIEADGNGSFTLNLNAPAPDGGLTVNYTVSGTATSGADYQALSGTATIPAGQSSVTVPVLVTDDAASEADETVVITLASGAGYTVGTPGSATLDVFDDDLRVTGIAGEGNPAEPGTNGRFVVTFAAPAPSIGLTVRYTVSGTATNGSDYEELSGTLNVPAGATSATIPVTVIDDPRSEAPETVIVTLGRNRGYILGTATSATLTIADNDIRRATIVADGNPAEPSTDGGFLVNLAAPAPSTGLTVRYTVSGTATAGTDYQALSGTLTVPANATSARIPVAVIDDTEADANETVIVSLVQSPGYVIDTPNSATLTIGDDEPAPDLSATIEAGTAPAEPSTNGSFVLRLSGAAPSGGVTVNYTVGGTATNGVDYELLSGSATVAAGQTGVTVPVRVLDDTRSEGPETITLALASGTGYAVGTPAQISLTLADDDIRFANVTVRGNAAEPATNGSFVVTLAAPAPSTGLTVRYTVGGTASAGSDYQALSGVLNIPANATSAVIPVAVIDDDRSESSETIVLTLGQSSGYVVGTQNSATMTIADDDIRFANVNVGTSAGEPATNGSFVVTLAAPAPSTGLTIRYTMGGTAIAGNDYEALSGTASIPAGGTQATIPVTIIDDTLYEPNDTLVITLGQNPGYVIGTQNSATMTLGDNDVRTATVRLRANAGEPNIHGNFIVELNGPAPSTGLIVRYTIGGTATPGADYQALTGELTIPAGGTSGLIPITVIDDALVEPYETIVVTLGRSLGYVIGTQNTAQATIRDDEPRPGAARDGSATRGR